MRVLAVAVLSIVLLAGCQQNATVRDTQSRAWLDLGGAQVLVKQTIRVPAGRARVFLQAAGEGKVRVATSFDAYRPHCGFEIRPVDHPGFDIEPGVFDVTRVQRTTVMVVAREPVMLAALNLASGIDGGGSSSFHDGYHFYLQSDSQPDVMRMTCYGVFAQPYELFPPTVEEIAQALGDMAELRY